MLNIFYTHVSSLPNYTQDLLQYVSKERQERIVKFHFLADKKRALLAELLLRFSVNQLFHIPVRDLHLSVDSFGKPRFTHHHHLHFNLSHSGDYVICGISTSPLGLDVEEVKPIDLLIAKNFFEDSEYHTIMAAPKEKQIPLFYTYWTLEESYAKYIGVGLQASLKDFAIELTNPICLKYTPYSHPDIYFHTLSLDPLYKAAVCTENKVIDKITYISGSSLLHFFENS